MGIIIQGTQDVIKAVDGRLTVEGDSSNYTGIVTAAGGFKVGTAISIGQYSPGNATFSGIVTAANFVGDGSQLTGVAAGVWTEDSVGVSTIKVAGINTTGAKGTAAGAATSEGAAQVHGNLSVYDGFVMTDQVIDKHLTLPAGKNAILVGPVQVATGIGVTVEAGCTLLIA